MAWGDTVNGRRNKITCTSWIMLGLIPDGKISASDRDNNSRRPIAFATDSPSVNKGIRIIGIGNIAIGTGLGFNVPLMKKL